MLISLIAEGCKKDVGRPAAKEVGMGNPAEKTTGHPTANMISGKGPFLARIFLRLNDETCLEVPLTPAFLPTRPPK